MVFSSVTSLICLAVFVDFGLLCEYIEVFSSSRRTKADVVGSWTIRDDQGTYGEIDIIEGFNNVDTNFMTMHTDTEKPGTCTFSPPADQETGVSNQDSTDCGSDIGCSVIGGEGGYGTGFNNGGGGVYAMEVSHPLRCHR